MFLAAVTLGRPDRIAWAKCANAVVGALAAVVLAALALRIFRRRDAALTAGFLAAVQPTFLLASTDLRSEPLFLLLLLACGFLLLAAADRPSSNLAVLAGAFLALAALTRSSALVLTPLLTAPIFDRRHPRRAGAHVALSAFLGFGLALAPWTVRNAFVFHELILVNDGGGYVFYGRNADAALGLASAETRAELDAATAHLEEARRAFIGSLPEAIRASPSRLSRALAAQALAERRRDPGGTWTLLSWKARDWLRPYPDPRFWPRGAMLGLGAGFVVLGILAAVGFLRSARRGVAAFCLAFLAVTFAFHVAMETSWRYRAVAWDPLLVLYAAFGATSLATRSAPKPGIG